MNGRCDAEIGRVGRWRGCRGKAVVSAWHDVRTSTGGFTAQLDYCKRHAKRAGVEGQKGVTRVKKIV